MTAAQTESWDCGFDDVAAQKLAKSTSLPTAPASGFITVPVVIHNLYRADGTGYLPDAWIEAQMDTLNAAFARAAPYVSQQIAFNLVAVDRIKDTAWFDNTISNPGAIRSAVEIDHDRVLNIYVGDNPGGTGGLAYRDGYVYARWRGFAGYPASSGPSEGGTVVHEVGHYLGLLHIFAPNGAPVRPLLALSNTSVCKGTTGLTCSSQGDFVCDTPPTQGNFPVDCSASRNTCTDYLGTNGSDLNDDVHNYMDYTLDACWTQFTRGQNDRMRAVAFEFISEIANGDGRTIHLLNGLTVASNRTLTFYDADVLVGDDYTDQITANGSLYAEGTTFAALNPTNGWGGIRVIGSDSALDDVVIEGVSGGPSGAGASLAYIDSEPDISNSVIRNTVGPGVDGVYLGGAAQVGTIEEVIIQNVSGNGIGLSGEFDQLRFIDNNLLNNVGHGFYFGYGSAGFLEDNLAQDNGGQGLDAYDASVFLDEDYNGASGYNVFSSNDTGGVLARAGAVVQGGKNIRYRNNSLLENGQPGAQWYDPTGTKEGPDAWARDAGTVAYLQRDWWGRPANPDTTTCAAIPCAGGYTGTLFVDPMLASAPSGGNLVSNGEGGSAVLLVSSSFAPPSSFTVGGSTPIDEGPTAARAMLLDAGEAAGDGRRAEALGILQAAVIAYPGNPAGAVAVTETGQLVTEHAFWGGEDVSTEALASLEAWAAKGSPHRARALAALAKAQAAVGDRAGALATAATLAAEPDPAASLEGHVARFHLLLASASRSGYAEAANALSALERIAPGSEEAAWARHALTIEAGAEVAGAAPGLAEASIVSSAKTNGSGGVAEGLRLSVWPNPSAGVATVALALPEDADAEARVVVYDARGREVAVLHEGSLAAGAHRLRMSATLPSGTYLVRAQLGDAVLTRTLTVLR